MEFFARAAGYIPAAVSATALSLLPDDPRVLAYNLTILTERTSKGSGLAWKRANQIARDLLRWRKRRGIKPCKDMNVHFRSSAPCLTPGWPRNCGLRGRHAVAYRFS